jgi:hypothetical protein
VKNSSLLLREIFGFPGMVVMREATEILEETDLQMLVQDLQQ